MAVDLHPLLASSLVAVAPSPPTSGLTLTVTTGDGALFPNATYNVVATPRGVVPSLNNSEILRVASVSGDVLTFSARSQEGSTAQAIGVGWIIAAVDTPKTFTDIETTKATKAGSATVRADLSFDTAANWATNNPVLGAHEQAYETDTGVLKIGDGATHYATLSPVLSGTYALVAEPIGAAAQTSANTALTEIAALPSPVAMALVFGRH